MADAMIEQRPRRLSARRWWARRILRDYKHTRPPAHGAQVDHQRPEWAR